MFPFLFLDCLLRRAGSSSTKFGIIPLEKKYTNRPGVMPDWYSFTSHSFLYTDISLERLIFNAAEYCKDGLIPHDGGNGPWAMGRSNDGIDRRDF
ncbi:MAG: hypothetical protein U0V70_19760 [Terriglobia bacterium]